MPQLIDTGERAMPGAFNPTTIEHLHRYAFAQDFCRDKVVLDVASGEGYGSNLLAQVAKSVTGVEIFGEAVSHAKANYKRGNLEFMQGDVCKLPNPNEIFDCVTCFETLEHVGDHDAAISEIKRVLKVNGIAIISTPCRDKYNAAGEHTNPFHVKELELDEFRLLLDKYFKNVEILAQQMTGGTSLVPLDSSTKGGILYEGDFNSIKSAAVADEAVYAVAVVSDGELSEINFSTFMPANFDAYEEINRLKNEIVKLNHEKEHLKNSTSFKLGQKIIQPIHKIRALVKK